MVYKDLPAGTQFLFGKINTEVYDTQLRRSMPTQQYLKWAKTDSNNLAINVDAAGAAIAFDHARPGTGSNRYERMHGTKMYFESSIHKFLNCADESWKNVDEGDACPRSNGIFQNGFLSAFNEQEKNCLLPFSVTVGTPAGYQRKYGNSVTKQVYASLPSAEQLGTYREAGSFNILFHNMRTYITDPGTMAMRYQYGTPHTTAGECTYNIAPIVKIKDDAPVDLTENGQYIIRIPESDFSGDILSFLGILPAA